jgi:hypothetical protein
MIDLAAVGIIANPRGMAEQRVPCPHCDRGKRDDALGVNVETGGRTMFPDNGVYRRLSVFPLLFPT